jgi:hypothetical protein
MVSLPTVTFPATGRPRLRELLIQLGLRAPALLGASLPSLQRAVGGLPIRLGTVLAIQAALERLPTTPAELAKVVAAARAQHPAEEPQS